jgi:hypothetical protein
MTEDTAMVIRSAVKLLQLTAAAAKAPVQRPTTLVFWASYEAILA